MISSNLFCMKKISNIKESAKAENWTSKKELMNICKCSTRLLEQIVADLNCETDFAIQNHIKKGGYHNLESYYDGYLVRLIQAKMLSNQANQGRTSQVVKQATKDNLVALTNREAWEQFKALGDAKLETEERLKLEQQQNKKLQLENYKLNEENDYLKKLNDFNTTQLGYYTKKYHSWYDDYENY